MNSDELDGASLWPPEFRSAVMTDVTDRLLVEMDRVHEHEKALVRARREFGKAKYNGTLLPFDGRHTIMDALEEALDLSQYLMKELMEREAIADLLTRAALGFDEDIVVTNASELRQMAAKLRIDCHRSVPIEVTS